jgi:hypothetical protein
MFMFMPKLIQRIQALRITKAKINCRKTGKINLYHLTNAEDNVTCFLDCSILSSIALQSWELGRSAIPSSTSRRRACNDQGNRTGILFQARHTDIDE